MTSACSLFTSGLCMPLGGRGVCEEVGVYVRSGGVCEGEGMYEVGICVRRWGCVRCVCVCEGGGMYEEVGYV